jgi:DNA-binding NarL/FixJ family response regulator
MVDVDRRDPPDRVGEQEKMRLKLLIADDHQLMLDAIRLALESSPDIEIVGETTSGSQVVPLVRQVSPDVVLLDLRMPGMDGLRCLEALRQRHPEVKTVVLSGSEDPDVVAAAFQRGAVAFIVKRIDPADLPAVIRQAFDGNVFYPLEARPGAIQAVDAGLTQREADILRALADGLSNKQIAKQFWLSEQTIKFHLTNIYRKLGVGSRTEAVRHAYEHGLIENPLLRAAAP